VSKNWIKQLNTLPILHFNSCLTTGYSETTAHLNGNFDTDKQISVPYRKCTATFRTPCTFEAFCIFYTICVFYRVAFQLLNLQLVCKISSCFVHVIYLVLMIAKHFLAETRSLCLPEYNVVLIAGNIYLWSNLGIRKTKEIDETVTNIVLCCISCGLFMDILARPHVSDEGADLWVCRKRSPRWTFGVCTATKSNVQYGWLGRWLNMCTFFFLNNWE
jgi:hypothetical protein